MRIIFALILTSFIAFFTVSAFADAASTPAKVAVMDFPKILKNSPQMEAVGNKLKKEFKPRQDKIIALQKTLEADQSKLKRDASIMAEKEMVSLRDKIAASQRDIRRLEEDYLSDARAAQKKAMEQIVQKVNVFVKKVADKDGYSIVLQKGGVVYASDKVDITDQVIKELGKKG